MIWLGRAFLGEHFAVTRWLRRGGLHPIVSNGPAVQVAPGLSLLQVQDEQRALEQITGSRPQQLQTLDEVMRLLAGTGSLGFLHFSCHGLAERFDPLGGRLELDGGDLRLIDVQPAGSGQSESPLASACVMLNACQAGVPGITLSGHGGWAERFLQAGAAVFVAPSWSVLDSVATTFARHFYQALGDGIVAGEAGRRARLAVRPTESHDRLAYAVYAAPEACLQ
jgi:CHAT domain-containing protein